MVLATVTAFGSVRHHSSPLTITSPNPLPSGVVSTFYSTSLTATGGTAPYTWTWTACSGACNTGLGFNGGVTSTTGVLNGTPVNAGTSTFTFTVTDSAGATATGSFGVTIVSTPPPAAPPTTTPLAITSSGALPSGTASATYNASLTATGGTTPYNWAIQSCSGVCNSGISLSPGGVFSGTPINSGTSTYSVKVIDANGQAASASLSLTIAAAAPSNSTANYFVSPSGSNSNPCTQSSPCATPDYAVNNKASAGDIVQVAAGTYDYASSEVHFTKSGAAGNYITLTCATRGACKIQNSVTGNQTVVEIDGNYFTFDGFEVTNTSTSLPGNNYGIYIVGDHVNITRNTVHHIEIDCGPGGGGINKAGGSGSGDVYDSNLVYDISWEVSGCAGTTHGHAINFEPNNSSTVTITNNIVYHHTGGWGIQIQGGGQTTSSIIANNLIFSSNAGIVMSEQGGALDYFTVTNNIILNNAGSSWQCGILEGFPVTGTHNVYQNNDAYGNGGGDYCFNTGSQTGGISVDPSLGTTFINWKSDGSGDYHQKAGSPTIDAGTSSSPGAPKVDFGGNPRPQGQSQDIGAYEYPN
jgi:hypothetical protein